jgi:hypothetical protein
MSYKFVQAEFCQNSSLALQFRSSAFPRTTEVSVTKEWIARRIDCECRASVVLTERKRKQKRVGYLGIRHEAEI